MIQKCKYLTCGLDLVGTLDQWGEVRCCKLNCGGEAQSFRFFVLLWVKIQLVFCQCFIVYINNKIINISDWIMYNFTILDSIHKTRARVLLWALTSSEMACWTSYDLSWYILSTALSHLHTVSKLRKIKKWLLNVSIEILTPMFSDKA